MASLRLRGAASYATALLVVIVSAGCGRSASPTQPTARSSQVSRQAADDIARHIGASLARQGGMPLDQVGGSSVVALQGSSTTTERTMDEGEFSWWFSIQFFAADGALQTTYQHGSTARMTVESRARGRIVTAQHQARVGVHRLLDVRGLLPDVTTLEIDGAVNDTADCAFASGDSSRSYHLRSAGQLTDVMKLKNESVNPYPLSGTARWNVVADATSAGPGGTTEAHYEVTVVVTFNGTRHPTVQIDKRYTYRTDLVTGEVVPLPS